MWTFVVHANTHVIALRDVASQAFAEELVVSELALLGR